MKLGLNLKNILNERKISYRELAKRTKISASRICDIANEKHSNPGIKIVYTLSKELNITLDELVKGDEI